MKIKNNCPFCFLGCEFSLEKRFKNKNCDDLNDYLFQSSQKTHPLIKGKQVSFDVAINKIRELILRSHGIHLDGLGCDYEGLKSIFNFAELHRTSIDHMEGENIANLNLISQRIGGHFCTLGEVFKRSDLIIFSIEEINVLETFRNFLLESNKKRKILVISNIKNKINHPDLISLTENDFFDLIKNINKKTYLEKSKIFLKHFNNSKFITFLCTFNQNHKLTEKIFSFVDNLNVSNKRASILPINGKNNISGAVQYSLWKTGYPLRVQFSDLGIQYNPLEFKSELLSENKELQIYTCCFDFKKDIKMFKKNIFIGNPFFKHKKDFDVFIPTKIHGIHDKGLIFRGDGVTAVKLNKIIDSDNKSVSEIFKNIT